MGFNRDIWNKLESYVRKLARKSANVYVCTGPLYLPHREADGKMYVRYQVIGKNSVAVPTHFFKIVVYELDDHSLAMEAYVMPNQKIDNETPLKAFLVRVLLTLCFQQLISFFTVYQIHFNIYRCHQKV